MGTQKDGNQRLAELKKAYDDKRDVEALQLAQTLLNDPDAEVRQEARRILASCLFAAKRFAEASTQWEALFKDSDASSDWVSVVTSSMMAGEFEKADRYFPEAMKKLNDYIEKLPKGTWGPKILTGAKLLHYYAHAAADGGDPARALPKIRDLAQIYGEIRITDDHMLLTRGVFGLGSLCDLIEKAYPLTRTNPVWKDTFAILLEKLDPDGQSEIREMMKRLQVSET